MSIQRSQTCQWVYSFWQSINLWLKPFKVILLALGDSKKITARDSNPCPLGRESLAITPRLWCYGNIFLFSSAKIPWRMDYSRIDRKKYLILVQKQWGTIFRSYASCKELYKRVNIMQNMYLSIVEHNTSSTVNTHYVKLCRLLSITLQHK